MMASDRPASESTPETPIPLPPIPVPPVAPESTTIKPSAFLHGLDIFQAAGVVLLAFLLASFAVRNPDFFQHIATGRLIAEGNYSFGTDPFCYTTEGQTWVNHAWVYDWLTFQLYVRFGGAAVVIFKAIVIAALAAVLLLTRKSSHSLWFAVVGVGLAMVAMAPRMVLQPMILSFFFFGLTLLAVTHLSRSTDRKRLPITIGVLFALWSNCDQWFFFGPLTLLLFLVGEWIPFRLGEGKTENRFDVKALATALGVGVLTCMINPHHVDVWQIPELFNTPAAELAASDNELPGLFQGVQSPSYFSLSGNSRQANPANGFALVFLFLFGLLGFAVNLTHLRWSHLLLFVTFGVLAMSRYRLVPFFTIATVVVSNWNFGAFVERLTSRPVSASLAGMIGFPRALARALSLLIGLGLLVAVRPGALNMIPREPLLARWLTWDVEVDGALAPAAETLQRWREENRIPSTARALVLDLNFASYLNWYAPSEKTFADYRLNLHEGHLGDFVLLRTWLRGKLEEKNLPLVSKLFEKYGITHLVIGSPERSPNFQQAASLLPAGDPLRPGWTLWNLQGKVWVLGWAEQKTISSADFDRLAFDPVKQVFAPEAARVDEPRDVVPFGVPGWIEAYWDIPLRIPPQIDESFSFWGYNQILRRQASIRFRYGAALAGILAGPAAPGMVPPGEAVANRDAVFASAWQSIRDARQAAAINADSPEAFLMLARAYDPKSTRILTLPEFAEPMIVANLQRVLLRAQPATASESARTDLFDAIRMLSELYRQNPQGPRIDLMVALSRSAEQYRELRMAFSPAEREEAMQAMNRPFGNANQPGPTPHEALERLKDQYELAIAGLEKDPLTRALVARVLGLSGEAYDLLSQIQFDSTEESEGILRAVVDLDAAEMGLATGNVEEAYKRIQEIETRFSDRLSDPNFLGSYQKVRVDMLSQIKGRVPVQVQFDPDLRVTLRQLKVRTCLILGKFSEAIQEDQTFLQQLEQNFMGKITPDFVERYRKAQRLQEMDVFSQFLFEPTWLHRFGKEIASRVRTAEAMNQVSNEGQILETSHILHVRLGLMNLEKGDNGEARFHFEQAIKPFGIAYVGRYSSLAAEYSRLLNAAK